MSSCRDAFEREVGSFANRPACLPHDGTRKRIKLALQGGGAYGAYSAGVVIQLLLDPHIEIVEISGTSAGEKIALIVADRINAAPSYDAGRMQAIDALLDFWGRVVKHSAPAMHALDAIAQPLGPMGWARFLASASSLHGHLPRVDSVVGLWRGLMPWNLPYQTVLSGLAPGLQAAESDLLFGPAAHTPASPNLPALAELAKHHRNLADALEVATRSAPFLASLPRGIDLAIGSLQSVSAAAATDAIRSIVADMCTSAPDPRDSDDRIFTHAASGKFIKVYINTAMELADGTLKNCVHTGEDITLKRSMGSSALMGFFDPSVIDGKNHWDGGYTENTCLNPLKDSPTPCDAIVIVGTNRPVTPTITPRLQSTLTHADLSPTNDLVLHQMYDEAVWHAQNWKAGEPTWHMVTYNHAPDQDWTAKQNTTDWHIRQMIMRGQSDGVAALASFRPYIGVRPTIDKKELEAIAREGLSAMAPTTKKTAHRRLYAA